MTVVEDPPDADESALPEGLTEEEAYLAAILMDRSGVDIAEFLVPDHTSADGCFRLYPFQWSWWREENEQEIDQCVAAGQLVLSARGHVPIEEVFVGDQVLTHHGRWRRVTGVFDRGERDVVCVKGQGHPGLVVTEDHPIYARRAVRASKPKDGHKGKKLRESMWLTPRDWEWNDNSGVMTANWGSPAVIEALPLPDQMCAAGPGRQNHVVDCWSESWMWLLGCFIAEGSTYHDDPSKGPKRLKHCAVWSVHRKEVPTVTAHLDKVGLNWNLDPDGECTRIAVNSKPVSYWLDEHAGRGAHHKRIAPWVFGLPEVLRRKVFEGASYGDGWERRRWSGKSGVLSLRDINRCCYSTVSRELAVGFRLLALSLGQSASVTESPEHDSVIDGRTIHGSKHYTVECQPTAEQLRSHVSIVDGSAWAAVRSITPAGRARVFDLEVEEDHSFIVEGIAVHNCSRDVGKSERICVRSIAFPFNFPGAEHALVAPEGAHLDRLTNRIEGRIKSVRLFLEMVTRGANGITHRPFHIDWRNAAQTYALLPQRSGIGVKGVHAVWLDVDEAQDVPENAWKEMPMTVRKEVEGHRWVAHGVSKGVRTDTFFRITQPGSGWTVQRYTQLHKPTYDPKNRPQLIKDHGGSDTSGDFLRNVYGEHGDTQNRIFVLQHFNAAVDDRTEGSDVNDEYYQPTITGDELAAMVGSKTAVDVSSEDATAAIQELLQFPIAHRNKFKTFWAGMDVGLVGDPSEICVLAEYAPDKREREIHKRIEIAVPDEGLSRFRLVSRIRVLQLPEPLQADLIMWLIQYYEPKAFSLDAGGNGLPVYQELMKRAGRSQIAMLTPPEMPDNATDEQRRGFAKEIVEFEERKRKAGEALTVIKGYKFGSKILVDFNPDEVEKLGANPSLKDMVEKAGINQEAKTRATDVLRTMVDNRRMLFPNDREFYDQMNGQTFVYSTEPIDAYGKRRAIFSSGTFHILDAMRFFALGQSQDRIEQIVAAGDKPKKPVIDRFVTY